MARRERGYTLVELVVVLLIFSVVLGLISTSFQRISASSGQLVRQAETDIGGLIGLELLRSDLELAGFGLPWSVSGASYSEAESRVLVQGYPGTDPSLFNDASPAAGSPGAPPRAIIVGNNVGINASDYLVLKGAALGMSSTSRRWSYLNYSSVSASVKPWRTENELVPGQGERVIVLRPGYFGTAATRDLVTDAAGKFSLTFELPLSAPFRPASPQESLLVYGVAPVVKARPFEPLAFPFNRADYFISRTAKSSPTCAPGTGTLYKTVLNHDGAGDGDPSISYYPLLDCVGDLQVIFGLDTSHSGEVSFHLAALDRDPSDPLYDAQRLRDEVREVRVYILAQQGKKDPGYRYPVPDPKKPESVIVVGDEALDRIQGEPLGSVWSLSRLEQAFGAEWFHYRWRVYSIVVQPKNL